MGLQQRLLDDEEERLSIAKTIAIEAGIVKGCSFHEGFFYAGHTDFQKAYRIAASKIKRGDFNGLFETQKELTDLIKEFAEDNSYESSCARCVELIERD